MQRRIPVKRLPEGEVLTVGSIRPKCDLRITNTTVSVNGVELKPRERARIAQPLVAEFIDERGGRFTEDQQDVLALFARWLRNYL